MGQQGQPGLVVVEIRRRKLQGIKKLSEHTRGFSDNKSPHMLSGYQIRFGIPCGIGYR